MLAGRPRDPQTSTLTSSRCRRTDWATWPSSVEIATSAQAIDNTCGTSPVRRLRASEFRDGERGRVALIRIAAPRQRAVTKRARRAGRIEEALRERCPGLAEMVVHTEPADAAARQG